MEYGGYAGNILRIDLRDQSAKSEPLNREDVRRFVGGRGIGSYYLFKEVGRGVNPFDPENKLFFSTGPLTGTEVPTSSRFVVTTKSPLTGIYCYAVSGGNFGPSMKKAGYDLIVVEGKALKPTYLVVDDGVARFRDASSFWDLPTFETARLLQESHGHDFHTIQIGPAGERMVSYSAIITDDRRAAARGGVGAVMGSKNLKAIMVRGKKEIAIANREAFNRVLREAFSALAAQRGPWKEFPITGTQNGPEHNNRWGILPTRNWRDSTFEEAAEISYPKLRQKLVKKDTGCPRCPVRCTKLTVVSEGPYAGASTDGPDYETLYALGSNCGVGKPEAITAADRLCDDLGLDTMSAGVSIAWAMENCERGVFSLEDMEGLDLRFGNDDAMTKAIRKIAYHEGRMGALLAQGVRKAAAQVGQGSDRYAMHAKGMEFGGYDARGSRGQALVFACGPRGGCHHAYGVGALIDVPAGIGLQSAGKGSMIRDSARSRIFCDSATLCTFVSSRIPPLTLALLIEAATGIGMRDGGWVEVADRIAATERTYNGREGLTRHDDTLPSRLFDDAVTDGPNKGQVIGRAELETLKDDFYQAMNWNVETGLPTVERLRFLELNDIAQELEQAKTYARS